MISDHALIRFVLPLKKPIAKAQWVTCRACRLLSRDAFASDLEASELCADVDALADTSADDLIQLYCDILTGLLNKHCPAVKVCCRPKKATPWFDADCSAALRYNRATERRFRRSRSSADKLEWDRKMKSMRSLYNDEHDGYWCNKISVNKGNTQGLWRTRNGILGDSAMMTPSRVLPTTVPSISRTRSILDTHLLLQRRRMMFHAGSTWKRKRNGQMRRHCSSLNYTKRGLICATYTQHATGQSHSICNFVAHSREKIAGVTLV